MLTKSYQYGITPVSQIPLYNLHQDDITSKYRKYAYVRYDMMAD
jgi:hypothetical protein